MERSQEELIDKKISDLQSIDRLREKFIRDKDHIDDGEGYIPLDSDKRDLRI